MHGRTPHSPRRPFSRTFTLLGRAAGVALGCSAACPTLLAQSPAETPVPASAPQPAVIVPRIIVTPSTTPTLEPVRPNLPPIAAQDLSLTSNPPLLREGAFISGARCQLVKGKSGRWYAIFDADGSGRTIPPMIVLENANLAAMERVAGREPTGTRVKISGRVTVYRDRNFLLPTAPPLLERAAAADPEAAANAASRAASAAASSATTGKQPPRGASEPSIEQIIADLDKAVGARKTGTANTSTTTSEIPTRGPATVQEPTEPGVTSGYLTSRRARIIRGPDGNLAAVMDSGSIGRSEGPMTLLPCQNLSTIESLLDANPAGAEAMSFTLTGDVFLYKGRRYLLPSMYTVNRSSDIVMPTH
jgi:hypothetical protein